MDSLGYAYFGLASLFALLGAIVTVTNPNPIRGAMGLLVMITSIAGLYLSLNAEFLAAIQMIVYAGAIVVMFIFVIMLLGPSAQPPLDDSGKLARYGGASLFLALGSSALFLLFRAMPKPKPMPEVAESFGTIDAFGRELFTEGIIPFELVSALLLVAVVGAVAVARGKHGELAESKMAQRGLRAQSDEPTEPSR